MYCSYDYVLPSNMLVTQLMNYPFKCNCIHFMAQSKTTTLMSMNDHNIYSNMRVIKLAIHYKLVVIEALQINKVLHSVNINVTYSAGHLIYFDTISKII